VTPLGSRLRGCSPPSAGQALPARRIAGPVAGGSPAFCNLPKVTGTSAAFGAYSRRGEPWRGLAALALAAVALLAACSRETPPRKAAASVPPAPLAGLSNAWAETEAFVNLGPKPSFSVEGAKAAEHIEGRLKAAGLEPVVDVFTDATPAGPRIFRNVTAELPGTTGLVVLIAHVDTKAGIATNFVGANDSGSGVGVLLALARCLRAEPSLPIGVLFAFVDGEECLVSYGPIDGLHGSRRLNARLEPRRQQIRGVLVLDMIGDRDLTVTIPRNATPQLLDLVFRAAHRYGVRNRFRLLEGFMTDDHVPFFDTGYPAIDLIDFEYGSAPGANDFWHTDKDTLDKLSPESLATVGAIVWDVIYSLPTSEVPAAVSRPAPRATPRRATVPRKTKPPIREPLRRPLQ